MVTAEVAATVPAVVLVLTMGLSAVQLGADRLRCQDAARVAVRELARGEGADRATARAQRVLPAGSRTAVSSSGREVSVTVTVPSPRLLRELGVGSTSTCSSTAMAERGGP